jgi:Kdo2-lipid IVA lauroyltransferase/acyltransferase
MSIGPNMKKRFQHRLEYVGARCVLFLCSLAPLGALRSFGAGLGWVAYRIIGIRRGVALQNIMSSLDVDREAAGRIALESYKNFGRSMMETSALGRLTGERLLKMVTIEGSHHLDEALSHGKGALVVTGHLGNWEIIASAIPLSGYPLYAPDTRHSNPMTRQIIIDLRSAHGATVLDPEEPLANILRLLSENNVVAYLFDQDAGRDGVFVEFFGRPASTRRAPALIAMRRGCPIIPVFIVREGTGHHRFVYRDPIWPDATLKGRMGVAHIMGQCTKLLEEMIRRHPTDYFWVHRRWKTQPTEDAKAI